jgi:hypothetical protein
MADNTPTGWLNLQSSYGVMIARESNKKEYDAILLLSVSA